MPARSSAVMPCTAAWSSAFQSGQIKMVPGGMTESGACDGHETVEKDFNR